MAYILSDQNKQVKGGCTSSMQYAEQIWVDRGVERKGNVILSIGLRDEIDGLV